MLNLKIRRALERPGTLKKAKRLVEYSGDELREAFQLWAGLPTDFELERVRAWENYCDIRDGLPKGTTRAIRFSAMEGDGIANAMDLDS
jgi:hypothetical protein